MPRQPPPQWLRLGAELRRLRSLSGLTTRALAAQAGLSNARVSRVELGQSLLSLPELDEWAAAVSASPEARSRLRELAEVAHGTVEPFRVSQARRSHLEENAADLETRARHIVTVQPQVVPGLLQTAEYARRLLELVDPTRSRDIPAAVAARMHRQEALYDHRKRFEFILTESALRWPAGDWAVMAAQYDRIASVSTLTNVTLGIIPLGTPVSAIPWCDMNIYAELGEDETTIVDVELPHGEVWVTEPDDVAVYLDLARKLRESALSGDEAKALLARLTRDLASAAWTGTAP